MINKLKHEKSPYLKQHADNPVEWFPWGQEAFQKAKEENKPVFLSIGYATCHWCHVMAHESFEDPEIASLMNDAFINVKVDREERPDIDSTYMTVCQMLTGQGGWPLTIIMTPDKEPFFAGTYIPKNARFNHIGLKQLIPGVSGMWKNEPNRVEKATAKIREGFTKSQDFENGRFPGMEAVDFAAEQLANRYDEEQGGFGQAPKFPSPHNLMFLLRQWKLTGEERFLTMVSDTLKKMRLGGIWDHIGFGFHRYSTDKNWLLPHFEKMLYDQALLLMAYTECWQATGDPTLKKTAYEIIEYVQSNLLHPEGGFYSAEDADSEGEEGKFYVWTQAELQKILSVDDHNKFIHLFNILEEGNFEDEATQEKNGKNIPHLNEIPSKEEDTWYEDIRATLEQARAKRIRPLLDDKILTDWNSLMIAALSKAGYAFNDASFLNLAENALKFLEKELVKEDKLLHRYNDGEAAIEAMADDYAFLTWAYIELYEATFKPEYLRKALSWNSSFLDAFWDEEKGGFFLSIMDEDQVYGRQKQIFDGAIPSSNSASILNLIRLSRLTGETELENYADKIGKAFSADMIRSGASITMSMQAIQFLNAKAKEVSLLAEPGEVPTVLEKLKKQFNPFSVLHVISEDSRTALAQLAPYTMAQKRINEKPSLYVCKEFSCDTPLDKIDDMLNALG